MLKNFKNKRIVSCHSAWLNVASRMIASIKNAIRSSWPERFCK